MLRALPSIDSLMTSSCAIAWRKAEPQPDDAAAATSVAAGAAGVLVTGGTPKLNVPCAPAESR